MKELIQNGTGSFNRRLLISKIPKVFYNYDDLNVRKRLYDVLNIFLAIGYLKKEKSKFVINKSCFEQKQFNLIDRPSLRTTGEKNFSDKQQKFFDLVTRAVFLLESSEESGHVQRDAF